MDPNLMGLILAALVILAVIFFNRRPEPAVPAQPATVQPLVPAQPVIILAQTPVAHVAQPVLSLRNVNRQTGSGLDINDALELGCEVVEESTPYSYIIRIKQPKLHKPINTFIDDRVNYTQGNQGNQNPPNNGGNGQQGQQGNQGNNRNNQNQPNNGGGGNQGNGRQNQNQGNNQNQPNNGGGGNQGGNQNNRRGNGN